MVALAEQAPRLPLPPGETPGAGDDQEGRIVARQQKMPPWDVTPEQLEDVSAIYRYG